MGAMALAEPEADPALVYTNTLPAVHSPLVYTSGLQTPLVYNTPAQTPVVYKLLQKTPVVHNTPVQTPVVYTSAVKTPLVYHYGKREAEAEPEAEADPALIYTNTLPAVHSTVHSAVHSPLVYTSGLQTPLVYNSAVKTPLVYNTTLATPILSKVFPSLKTAPVVSHIAKREAEADPALLYTTRVHQPLVYNTALHQPIVYNTAVTPLLKTADNAVVPSAGGYIHSSHVGVCTNNLGVRVPC